MKYVQCDNVAFLHQVLGETGEELDRGTVRTNTNSFYYPNQPMRVMLIKTPPFNV